MNCKELTKVVATNALLTQKQADAAVTALIDTIEDTVAEKGSVSILGFGTFSAQAKAAKTGRNPRTGEAVEIAAKTVPVFKAGKEFKEKVNK